MSEKKIFERNKDVIRSRKPLDYGNEVPEKINADAYDKLRRVKREVLDELWSANKVNHQGHWYIRLTDVVSIIGDDSELYENESKS